MGQSKSVLSWTFTDRLSLISVASWVHTGLVSAYINCFEDAHDRIWPIPAHDPHTDVRDGISIIHVGEGRSGCV